LSTQDEKNPRNNSPELGRVSDVSSVVPKLMSLCFTYIEALLFDVEAAFIE
jgi:hypothetical protein